MSLPQEVEVWYVIPTVRKELSKALLELGLTQKEVAAKLGLTGAAVSQYLKGKRGKDVELNEVILKKIKVLAKKIKGSSSKSLVNKEIVSLTNHIRKTCLCKIHKGLEDRKGCSICRK